MITLPQISQHKAADKSGTSDPLANDSEGTVEDFSLLVQHAKGSTTLDVGKAVLLPEAASGKTSVKRDVLLKQVAELTNPSSHLAPQETLAALLVPVGKSNYGGTKEHLTPLDNGDADSDTDLQAISALLAMLPQQQPIQALPTPLTGKAVTSNHTQNIAAAGGAPLTVQSHEVSNASPPLANSSAAGISDNDEKISPRAGDAHLSTGGHTPPSVSAALSSSTPVVSTGTPIATPATPILNSQLGSQEWQQQLSQQVVLFTRQGVQQAELRLHPEHLGKVEINLKLDDNQLQLQIMSPHNHVRAAIEAAIPMLRTSLNESGLQLSQSQVGGEGSMHQQHTGEHEQQGARQNGVFSLDAQDDEDIPLAVGDTLLNLAQGKGSVDIFA